MDCISRDRAAFSWRGLPREFDIAAKRRGAYGKLVWSFCKAMKVENVALRNLRAFRLAMLLFVSTFLCLKGDKERSSFSSS